MTVLHEEADIADPVLKDGAASYTPGVSERLGSTTTFTHSGLKNGVAQSTAGGSVAATRLYDAFGNVTSSSLTWQGPFGYGGQFGYQEDSSGLKLLGHRYYDSAIGRFLTRDPIQDGRNWHAHCDNDPVAFYDVEGLRWIYDQATGQLYCQILVPFPGHIPIPFLEPVGSPRFSGRRDRPTVPRGRHDPYRNRPGRPRNNHGWEDVPEYGPLPAGDYTIGHPVNDRRRGNPTLRLTPTSETHMHGRDGFLIHGGSAGGDPSHGCIILSPEVRRQIADSGDNSLTVI